MFIYLLVCLLITFLTLEHYLVSGHHPKAQRLLPLVLGLICVYNFYVLVEWMTQEYVVFGVLKYLMIVQMMYLLVYYILDFLEIQLPFFINLIFFIFILINNILICVDLYSSDHYGSKLLIFIIIFVVLFIITGTVIVIRMKYVNKLHNQYILLYLGLLLPLIAVIITYIYGISDVYLVPGAMAFFCIIINYLMSTNQFADTPRFIKEDLFNQLDRFITIFDADMEIIDCTQATKELFPEYVDALIRHKDDNHYKKELIRWAEENNRVHVIPRDDKYYKCILKTVYRKKKVLGYIVTVIDVTSEVSDANSAKKALKDKSEFLANMSHELRSPLHAIIGAVDIMLATGNMSSGNKEMARHVKVAGHNLLGIVNSILDYSKIENQMMELYIEQYDLKLLLEEQFANSMILVQDKEIELKLEVETEIPKILIGDKNRVRSIFQNLISNATKYTNEGHIYCKLYCEKIDDSHVRLRFVVEDTGIGISEENQKRLFSKYMTVNMSNVGDSTGIGLALIKHLLELMNGNIVVESDGVNGSVFKAEFEQEILESACYKPFVVNKNTLFVHRDGFEESVTPSQIYPMAKVLVVDDIGVNREILIAKLEPWKMQIFEAKSGEEAVEIAKDNVFDFIFMDQMMSGIDGLDASRKIRELYEVPIVMISANTSDDMREQAEKNGLADYIAKPFTQQNLKEVIEKHMKSEARPYYPENIQASLLEMGTGDKAYKYSLQAYVETMEELSDILPTLFETDAESFRVKVHGIKGTCRQLGRTQMAMYSETCEMAIESKHIDYLRKIMPLYVLEMKYDIESAKQELEAMG